MKKIITFGHRKRVGKDTAAKFVMTHVRTSRKNSNIRKAGFADKLKDVCYQIYGWAGLKPGHYYEENPAEKEKILPALGKSARTIWIEFGTYVGRAVWGTTWIDYLLQTDKSDILLVSDCRFPNEADKILELGGFVVKIENPNVPYTSDIADDPLEDYKGWSEVIVNDGSLSDFYNKVTALTARLL